MRTTIKKLSEIKLKLGRLRLNDIIEVTKENRMEFKGIEELLGYHIPMDVTEYYTCPPNSFSNDYSYDSYPMCPRCGIGINFDYQRFCGSCGQRLNWISFRKMTENTGWKKRKDEKF